MRASAQVAIIFLVSAAVSGGLALLRGLPRLGPQPLAEGASAAACVVPEELSAMEVRWISQAEAVALTHDAAVEFVDCRPVEHFVAGHVSGSLHLPIDLSGIEPTLLDRLRAAATVITYCDAESECERSLRMAHLLQGAGVGDVRVLEGGMPQWLANGYPAESGNVPN